MEGTRATHRGMKSTADSYPAEPVLIFAPGLTCDEVRRASKVHFRDIEFLYSVENSEGKWLSEVVEVPEGPHFVAKLTDHDEEIFVYLPLSLEEAARLPAHARLEIVHRDGGPTQIVNYSQLTDFVPVSEAVPA